MFGGTPSNIAFAFHNPGKVEIVTGVNLPMIVKIATQGEGLTLEALANLVYEKGRSSIAMASSFLTT
jgi:PTS system mannose-specific IIA component